MFENFVRERDMIGKFPTELGNVIEMECGDKAATETITFGIYCPSYKRYAKEEILTYHCLENVTYVVRKTEYDKYIEAGIHPDHLIGVDDQFVNSAPKVRQWILTQTPEDVIIMIDDDISKFKYMTYYTPVEMTPEQITTELVRVAVQLHDLKLGLGAMGMTGNPMYYTQEFIFLGGGGVNWYNKKQLKAKNDPNLWTKDDIDLVLQELLYNRVTWSPRYFSNNIIVETNPGGTQVNKNTQRIMAINDYLYSKWGKYYVYDAKKNVSRAAVKR